METYENQNYSFKTKSSLSEWVGPNILSTPMGIGAARNADDTTPYDTFEWTTRMIDLLALTNVDHVQLGPADPQRGWIDIMKTVFENWKPIMAQKDSFQGFSYDSIELRITMSNPKGIVGAVIAGWLPYVDYYDEDVVGTMDCWNNADLASQTLFNSTDSQLILLGNAQDCTLSIPWSFKFPFYQMTWLDRRDTGTQNGRPPYGSPILYWNLIKSNYVSSVTLPAQMRVYMKFHGLKFYGPGDFSMQSGSELIAGAALAAVTDKAFDYISEITGAGQDKDDHPRVDYGSTVGNYDNPSAVQMSYYGDTTSVERPQTRPPFISALPGVNSAPSTLVSDYLKRPQFISAHDSTTPKTEIFLDPVNPATHACATYFTYFGMINRHWRGTLNVHVVVAGHPMVETLIKGTICYPDSHVPTVENAFNMYAQHASVFHGSKHIIFPLPYLTNRDYTPICDPQRSENAFTNAPSRVIIECKVVSTMLDVQPIIPYLVFISAGPDFKFFQPYPPGLYYSPEVEDLEKSFVMQIGLPLEDEIEVASTRAATTPDPGVMVAFNDFYDYMRIWSRAVPFFDYDNDGDEEPIPDANIGMVSPCWFPPVDRARDWDVNNSWYFTLDYVHYLSILFLYWRGSIGGKVVYNGNARKEKVDALFVSLSSDFSMRWPSHCPFPYDQKTLPSRSNFGAGTFCTATALQPVLEYNVPYRGPNTWAYTIYNAHKRGVSRIEDNYPDGVTTNVELQNPDNDVLSDAMFRKVDTDFALSVSSTMPPPAFWLMRGSRSF